MNRAALVLAAFLLTGPAAGAAWEKVASAGVDVSLSSGETGVRMSYDFHGGSGWAGVRRAVALDFPDDWTLTLRVRGSETSNTLEIKFVDATGENVWWARREGFTASADWQTIAVKKRQVKFAWGPAGGGELRQAAAIEIVLSAGTGGRGFLEVGEPVLAERQRAASFASPQVSKTPDGILLDFGGVRELSGLVVDWPAAVPPRFTVEISSDARAWAAVRRVTHGGARRALFHLPETEARYVRLVLPPGDFGTPAFDVRPVDWAPTANDFVAAIAKSEPRGAYPRAFLGEQTYWTVAGVDADTEEVLVGEDGALEPGKGSFSLEPFLFTGGRLVTWADAAEAGISHTLERGDLPIPTVTWKTGELALDVTALVDGAAGSSALRARYRVRNAGKAPARVRLFVAVRPFLVNPPSQFLNAPRGVARIASLSFRGSTLTINGTRTVVAGPAPSQSGVAAFDEGPISDLLLKGRVPAAPEIRDESGLASGWFAWDLEIPARDAQTVVLDVPLHAGAAAPLTRSKKEFDLRLAEASAAWGNAVDQVRFRVPSFAEDLVRTLRSNLAYVLVNRDGPWIQPGSRAYERSWIRDGALTSSALLRLGHSAAVRDFLIAFAAKQFPDGKIPCCVDARGADPVPEHDSHGEFLFLAAEYFRFTGDRETLRALWPRIEKTVAAIDALRRQRRTPEYERPEKRAYFGLLPESISHEGYSDKPVHSYWDDAFARKGLADAAELAASLGHPEEARSFLAIATGFEADLLASIALTIEQNHLDTLPASVEKHDFDPTSTTVSLSPGGLQGKLPQAALARTFDRYVKEARERRDGTRAWDAYTPYELRTVGALVRLGRKTEAHEMLSFFMKDRRPAAWNQWAEVVGRDPRAPRFIGDMPHTWVGTDFIRSFLDFFAIEREGEKGGSLLLGAGLPEEWLRGPEGVGVQGLLTIYGPLDLAVSASGGEVRARISGVKIPPGGLALAWPLRGVPRAATVNGRPAEIRGGEILVREVPAEVVALP